MGTIKDRNGRDLTEAEDIKRRWQEYTKLYKKHLHDPDNHDGVITHLKPAPLPGSSETHRKGLLCWQRLPKES